MCASREGHARNLPPSLPFVTADKEATVFLTKTGLASLHLSHWPPPSPFVLLGTQVRRYLGSVREGTLRRRSEARRKMQPGSLGEPPCQPGTGPASELHAACIRTGRKCIKTGRKLARFRKEVEPQTHSSSGPSRHARQSEICEGPRTRSGCLIVDNHERAWPKWLSSRKRPNVPRLCSV